MPVISPNAFAPPAANDRRNPALPKLREQVRRLERPQGAGRAGWTAVPVGVAAIDALLPEGGLLTGALHEIEAGPTPSGRVAAHDGAALGFASYLLGCFSRSRPAGTILWCRQPLGVFDAPPYAPALSGWFDPARLLMVTVRREEDLFWAMEEGLRAPGIVAVLGETCASDLTAGRRLSLATEKNGVPALLLRSQPAPPQSVCTTRWRVASAPSPATAGLDDLGAARWRIELRRNRFGTPSSEELPSWLVEWNDETHHLAVVPQARHGSAGPPQAGTGTTGFGWADTGRQRLVG
jgi:protein ImuA